MIKMFVGCCALLTAVSVQAVSLTDEECETKLRQAEKTTETEIYDQCGFDQELKAWDVWAPFVAAHDMKKGIYELCRRYPNHSYGSIYCDKAIALNYGPALRDVGYQKIEIGREKEALEYFQKALKSKDLTADDILKMTEKVAFLYLDDHSELYNPTSGVALLKKAALDRSAVANNLLAYLTYSGEANVKLNFFDTEKYLWRAILLGCPAAEENLGAYHLVKQKKITLDEARFYMSLQSKTCEPFDKNPVDYGTDECDCKAVLNKEAFYQKAPYLYLEYLGTELVKLRDQTGREGTAHLGDTLADGSVIRTIKPTLMTLDQNGKQILINRYHPDVCVDKCQKKMAEEPKRKPIEIKPYHLTFTKAECSEIDYFVNQQKLVDSQLPYVGKAECVGSGLDETTKLLLGE